MADGIQMANDAVASAKKALSNAANSNVAARKVQSGPSYTAVHDARQASGAAPTLGDELKAKSDNVSQYADAVK